MSKSNLVLLTGTIAPDLFKRNPEGNVKRCKINAALTDAEERLEQYENAISRYIKESAFKDIVFVENSGYDFPAEKYEKLAKEYNKNFEFLYRKLSEDEICGMLQRGKSWGEADLIDFAIKNSALIKNYEVIYKCTGRVFITNSKKILDNTMDNQFIKSSVVPWVKTHFFKLIIDDYYRYLQNCITEINDYKKMPIERAWYNAIIQSDIVVRPFKRYPRISGITGSSNRPYDKKKWKYFLIDLYFLFGGKKFRVK